MNTKLTLTIEQQLIEKAKSYAKTKGRSLSDIVANYLKAITKEEVDAATEVSPLISSLMGSFKEPEGFDEKKHLSEALNKKHLKNG